MKGFKIKRVLTFIMAIVACSSMIHCNYRKSAPLPSFNILLLDSTTVMNTSEIPEGKAFVLLYFSPDCDHCQRETKDLLRFMNKVRSTQFYFITSSRFNELRDFNNQYKLTSYSNITVGRDYQLFIVRNFEKLTTPYLVIYDKDKIERAVFTGESKASEIIEVLNKITG